MPNKWRIAFYFGFAGILPLLFFSIQDISLGQVASFDWEYFSGKFINVLTSYSITFFISCMVMFIPIRLIEQRIPWQSNVWKRTFIEFFATGITAVLARNMTVNFFILIGWHDYEFFSDVYWNKEIMNATMAVFMNIVLVSVYEGIVLFRQWKISLVHSEKLEKENMASKFEALKNQVNPHFLFNSLNTLSNLVHDDPDKAEDFIDEFSHIYRYVLEKKEQMVVTVREEIEFVKAYLKLCEIRFEKGLESDIKMDIERQNSLIPTLALQTLVENAIKHNQITPKKPLKILIYTDKNEILVENNYQPRDTNVKSTGVGLQNIKDRYALMSEKQPSFLLHNGTYIAKLPLIETT